MDRKDRKNETKKAEQINKSEPKIQIKPKIIVIIFHWLYYFVFFFIIHIFVINCQRHLFTRVINTHEYSCTHTHTHTQPRHLHMPCGGKEICGAARKDCQRNLVIPISVTHKI